MMFGTVVYVASLLRQHIRFEPGRPEVVAADFDDDALDAAGDANPDAPPGFAAAEEGAAVGPDNPADDPVLTPIPAGELNHAISKLRRTPTLREAPDIFTDCIVPNLRIEVPPEGMKKLRRSPRQYVTCTIREGRLVYTNVAIRLKGGPGSFRGVDDVPSFTINFDKFADGQRFHGMKKIHLNSSIQDRTYLSEKICRELFDAAGIPAPQAGHAIATFNSRTRLYVMVEGINKPFLKRYFNDATGNVYDGHSGSDVTGTMPVNSGDFPRDHTGLRALASAIRRSATPDRWSAIETTLDVDRFLTFMALETMLWHWDGYTMARNNFRVFHDREMNRMVFLPHGMDQTLSEPKGSVMPNTQGSVARAIMETSEGRQLYRARVAEIATNLFIIDAITNRIFEVSERVEAAIGRSNLDDEVNFHQNALRLARRFQSRARNIHRQLFPVTPLRMDERTPIALKSWEPRTDLGQADLTRTTDPDGIPTLDIATSSGCTASWRTVVLLDRGRYQIEGRIKTRGVVFPPDDRRAGAGLRVSRHREGQKNAGDSDWKPITFSFEVEEDGSEMELVCELRGLKGEISFDANSLKLRRQ